MALTKNGKHIGMAAHTERVDNMRYIHELEMQEQKRKRKELHEKDRAVYLELLALDPEGGETWYADDDNIPNLGSARKRIKLVQARIDELKYIRKMPQFTQDAVKETK